MKRQDRHEQPQFDRDFAPAYAVSEQLTPLVRRVVCDNPGPFTFTGTGTYIIGHGSVAIIDPGPVDDSHLAALLDAVRGESVSHILITHTHRDHSPLSRALREKTGAKILAYGCHGEGRRSRADAGGKGLDAAGDSEFVPDDRIGDGDVVTGPGWTLEAVFTPGHTCNHMSFALRQERALFTGDHVMAWSTSVIAPPDGHMGDYLASLEKLLVRDDAIYWPTHGPPRRRPQPFVRAFLTHRRLREEAILGRIRKGDETIADVVRHVYKDVDPRLHGAAALSTLAHVEHLIERGLVRGEDGQLTLATRYRPA